MHVMKSARPDRLPSGAWRIRWLDHEGKRRCESHPSYKAADAALRRHQSEVDQIRAGERRKPPEKHSFAELVEYYREHRMPSKSPSHANMLKCDIVPGFEGQQLPVGVADVDRFRSSLKDLGVGHQRNILFMLQSILALGHGLGWTVEEPKVLKPKSTAAQQDFDYLPSDDEIRRFLEAARGLGEDLHMLYSFAILTGLRKGEIAALRWKDVDLVGRSIRVVRNWTENDTKPGKLRYVPIFEALFPQLLDWQKGATTPFVFPAADGTKREEGETAFRGRLQATLDVAGFPKVERDNGRTHYIVFRDLRHTFASQWVSKGGDIFKLQQLLGHASVNQTMRYAHLAPYTWASEPLEAVGLSAWRSGEQGNGAGRARGGRHRARAVDAARLPASARGGLRRDFVIGPSTPAAWRG